MDRLIQEEVAATAAQILERVDGLERKLIVGGETGSSCNPLPIGFSKTSIDGVAEVPCTFFLR